MQFYIATSHYVRASHMADHFYFCELTRDTKPKENEELRKKSSQQTSAFVFTGNIANLYIFALRRSSLKYCNVGNITSASEWKYRWNEWSHDSYP